jgi:hypothetical protein
MRYAAAIVLVILCASAAAVPPAEACTCVQNRAMMVWPRPGTSGAAIDTTIVVRVSQAHAASYDLRDAAGSAVPLRTVRVLDGGEACALYDYAFLRPEAELAPDTTHTLTPSFPAAAGGPVLAPPATFQTGRTRSKPDVPTTQLWLYAEQLGAQRFLQIFAMVKSRRPAFVQAKGQQATVVATVDAMADETPVHLPIGVVPCAEAEVVDVTGATLLSTTMCEPHKCAQATTLGSTTCGEHPSGRSWAEWQSIVDGCRTPAPGPTPWTPDTDVSGSSPGCTIASGRLPTPPPWLPLTAALALAAARTFKRRRRRR